MTHDEITTRRSSRRARRGRADCCWGRGRRLVVVDVENIAGGPCKTEAAVAWVRRRLTDAGAVTGDDMVTVGVDECGLASVAWAWQGARAVYGHGRDGADRALLEVLAERIPERYDSVVLASGDGYYSFGTPMAALWAARHHKSPYLSMVFVNGSYSTGTTELREAYPNGYAVRDGNYAGGSFDPPPNFAKYAEAVDGYGEYVTETDRVGPALARAIEEVRKGSPAVVAVRVPGPLQKAP